MPASIWLNSGSNTIQGNLIGLTASGTAALGNGNNGIYLINAAGTSSGARLPERATSFPATAAAAFT